MRVVGGCRVQHDGDEGLDIVEVDILSVKSDGVVGVESRGMGASRVSGGASRPTEECSWMRYYMVAS
jgi:hypothetical protein